MERLTEHHYDKTMGAYMVCSGACIDDDFDCNNCKKLAEIVDRLSAYEDTGLEPGEAIRMAKEWTTYETVLSYVEELGGLDHLRELARAKQTGRLVVLPCKRGDTLWAYRREPSPAVFSFKVTGVSTLDGKTVMNTNILQVIPASDVGEAVFLTRAEAEAALEREKGEQNETD